MNRPQNEEYFDDQNFLDGEIWPLAQQSLMQHDAFYCDKYGGGRPFPTARTGGEHVGSIFEDGKMREGDVQKLMNNVVVANCTAGTGRG